MSNRYKVLSQSGMYFMTMTTVGWIDIFSRQRYRDIVMDSLRYCQKEKGLILHAYVVMTNHVHINASAQEGLQLSDIIRDCRKFTAKRIWASIDKDPKAVRNGYNTCSNILPSTTKPVKNSRFGHTIITPLHYGAKMSWLKK